MATDEPAPPPDVLERFGAREAPVRLAGGTSPVFRAGDLVIKPADDRAETEWKAPLLAGMAETGFRLARPVAATGGAWVAGGWSATRLAEGTSHPLDLAGALDASRGFHAALAGRSRPGFLDRLDHRWAVAHRVAWGSAPPPRHGQVDDMLGRLLGRLRPTGSVSQVVHCDLAGNVLFAPGLAPAVIDFSPWWAPVGYAEAILFADAVAWHGADPRSAELFDGVPEFPHMLMRALVFRVAAHVLAHRDTGGRFPLDVDAYRAVAELAQSLAGP